MTELLGFIRAGLRLSTPLLLASLGGMITYHAGVMNIAMEGMMMVAAFAAMSIAIATGSPWLGLFAAVGAAILVGLLYALFVIRFKADVFAVGITLNIFTAGVTAYVLRSVYKQEGVLVSADLRRLPNISIPVLEKFPLWDLLLNDYSLLIPLSLVLVVFTAILLYKTPYGYWIRAAGENAAALRTAGRSPGLVRFGAFMLSSILCGLAGAHLSIGYLGLFALGMVGGRGFIALAVVLFGRGRPLSLLAASMIFGFAEAASLRLPVEGIAPQFSLMLPYIVTIIAITILSSRRGPSSESGSQA